MVGSEKFIGVLNRVDNDVVVFLEPVDEVTVGDGVGKIADTNIWGFAKEVLSLVRRVLNLETDREVASITSFCFSSSRIFGVFKIPRTGVSNVCNTS